MYICLHKYVINLKYILLSFVGLDKCLHMNEDTNLLKIHLRMSLSHSHSFFLSLFLFLSLSLSLYIYIYAFVWVIK